MSAPISVIIPTLNAGGTIGPTLAALTEGLGAGLIRELIIVDGGSADEIAEIAEEVGAVFLATSPGRGGQLRAGAEVARGRWLMTLHADSVLSPGWSAHVRAHLEGSPDRAGYFRLRFDATGLAPRIVAGWANMRARLFGLPYGDQGLLLSRTLHDRAGGYPGLPLMEDVALVRRLKTRAIPAVITTSAVRYQRDGWLHRGWRNLTTLVLYVLGVSPDRLARRYTR